MSMKTLESNYVYKGRVVALRLDKVELPSGKTTIREVIEHPGAVGIIALTGKNEVVLIKQFRQAVGEDMWEIPAGKLEAGEDPRECAVRELKEETGFSARHWQKITYFYTSPGFANEILHLYLARGLMAGEQCLDPGEFIDIHPIPIPAALAKVKRGEICDAKTIISLLWWANMESKEMGEE